MKVLMCLASLLLLSASDVMSRPHVISGELPLKLAPEDQPVTYLVSIVDLPLREDDAIQSFAIETSGVKFNAVCRLPDGWRIRAGSSLTSQGVLEGNGSQGVTWPREVSPPEFGNLVLLTVYGPVQSKHLKDANGSMWMPATFDGHVHVVGPNDEQDIPLTASNVHLVPARACPQQAGL